MKIETLDQAPFDWVDAPSGDGGYDRRFAPICSSTCFEILQTIV